MKSSSMQWAAQLALVGLVLTTAAIDSGARTGPSADAAQAVAAGAQGAVGNASTKVPEGTGNLAEDIRIMLLRSYVPKDGRLSIDADPPQITIVKRDPSSGDLKRFELPDCPKRITDTDAFTDLFNDTKSETVEEHFRDMAADLGFKKKDLARAGTAFPYCSWWARINTKVYDSRDYTRNTTPVQDGMDIFLPDSDATYWAVPFDASTEPDRRGLVLDHVEIHGQFQEQLFMSYVLYDSTMDFYYYENAAGTTCQSYNTDFQIAPDPGSVNPWVTESTAYDDTYTLQLVPDPQGTDCSGGGPGAFASGGTDFNVLPLGRTGSGYGPTSPSGSPVQGDFFGAAADGSVPRASNACAYVGADLTPCSTPLMFVAPTAAAQNSVWSNPVAGYLAAGFIPAPDEVYVFRGKAPRVPVGASPVPWNDNDPAEYDMRYFSLCLDKKVWPYPAQDANWSCANGSFGSGEYNPDTNPDGLTRLAIGADGYWTVIVSSADLTDSQEVGDATVLRVQAGVPAAMIMRHMVVSDDFHNAVQDVPRDGAWTSAFATLGEYYPVNSVVCNLGQFEQRGWQEGGCFVPPVN
ncbi:hypothetical protein [Agromyces kandeliae]|uniref:Uncharacterized protein n=1 Tax=Agromyces kandeliae TaxID=2666141 RepID=A0A6L5R3Z1_9MICO|nr:hypothetical protein [Agromyces kandeliae]MRX44791.1 hypothetical protein [Agromyces kandeliae]